MFQVLLIALVNVAKLPWKRLHLARAQYLLKLSAHASGSFLCGSWLKKHMSVARKAAAIILYVIYRSEQRFYLINFLLMKCSALIKKKEDLKKYIPKVCCNDIFVDFNIGLKRINILLIRINISLYALHEFFTVG